MAYMKSEERHHLAENDLAQILDRWLKKVEPYSNQILVGILVATVVTLGVVFFSKSNTSAAEEAWASFVSAESADDFATVADDHPNSDIAIWARLRAGELYLAQGMQTVVSDRKSTTERLEQAESSFNDVLSAGTIPPRAREQALYGLAVVKETISDGNTQPAIETYEALLEAFPDSRFTGLAKQRIEQLKSEDTQSFYAWFDKQPRKPDERPEPKDLASARDTGPSDDPFLGSQNDPPAIQRHPGRPPSPRAATSAAATGAMPFPSDRSEIEIIPGEVPESDTDAPSDGDSTAPEADSKPEPEGSTDSSSEPKDDTGAAPSESESKDE